MTLDFKHHFAKEWATLLASLGTNKRGRADLPHKGQHSTITHDSLHLTTKASVKIIAEKKQSREYS